MAIAEVDFALRRYGWSMRACVASTVRAGRADRPVPTQCGSTYSAWCGMFELWELVTGKASTRLHCSLISVERRRGIMRMPWLGQAPQPS